MPPVALGLLAAWLLAAATFAATLPASSQADGFRPLRVADRIVGGSAVTIDQFPWTVSMQRLGQHRCGAALIAPRRILTAAHCTHAIEPGTLAVRAGSTYSADFGQLVQVTALHEHPQYNAKNFHNDLCVMWLERDVDTRPAGVAVVPMPLQGKPVPAGAYAYVTGWGYEREAANVNAKGLRAVSVPIIDQAQCKLWYRNAITDGMVCAGYEAGGKDACQNDSGGPLTVDGVLVGIVSWGVGCAQAKQPGVYARVAYYRNWIDSWTRVEEAKATPKPKAERRRPLFW